MKHRKLQTFLNNQKIRTKMIYVYLFCVLLPVLVTNTAIIGSMLRLAKNEQKRNINNIADGVAHNIYSSLESAVYITVDLYTSKSIHNFLDKNYEFPTEYLTDYEALFDNYVFYASSKHLVSGITFYSNNPSMLNGGKYYRISEVKDQQWYQQFKKNNEDLFVYTYYNKTLYSMQRKRMFSVIRKLNYCGKKEIEKVVKMDLNYRKIYEAVVNSAFGSVVYVCNDDKIIFSNSENESDENKKYMDISAIQKKDVQAHKTLSAYGAEWDIYITGYRTSKTACFFNWIWLIALLFIIDAVIPAFVLTMFSASITKRMLLLGRYLNKVKEETFELIPVNHGGDEIGELLDNYNLMAFRMKELIENEYRSKLEQQELNLARKQAELLALYSQINPHFIFNVLESIRMHSVIKKEKETAIMVESLGKLMRKCAQWGSDFITLQEELDFTQDYLKLQKYRFGDGFTYQINISDDCKIFRVPSLVLVTFAENACVHGLNKAGHNGAVFIRAYREGSCLYMEIEDTGNGIDEKQVLKLEKKLNEACINDLYDADSLGMLNACIRLKKCCGEQAEIKIESGLQSGTCIIIKIPEKESGENKISDGLKN
jgi:two-component system sensor histidine kinase YesM